MSDEITFRASFPTIQGAIRRSGDSGGMRIQLDIPESEMAQAVHLLAMVQKRLIVTVSEDQDIPHEARTPKRTKAKRRV